MVKRIVFDDARVGRFVAERAKCVYMPELTPTIGIVDDVVPSSFPPWSEPEILGGVVYSDYTHSACFIHAAGKHEHWATRDFLWVIFDYPFNLLGCSRIFSVVNENNLHIQKILDKLRFEEVSRLPGLFPDGDGLIFCLLRERCKWLSVVPRTVRRNLM